jgi:hypothetical protein
LEWDAAHKVATLALKCTETGRAFAGEMENYLMQEMMRVVQVVQGQVSTVRINQFAPDIEADWTALWRILGQNMMRQKVMCSPWMPTTMRAIWRAKNKMPRLTAVCGNEMQGLGEENKL